MKTQTIRLALTVILFSIISIAATAQKTTEYLKRKTTGNVECIYERITDADKGTIQYFVALAYVDKHYESLQDYAAIVFMISPQYMMKDFKLFIKDLKTASEQMNSGKEVEWTNEYFKLHLYEFSKTLWLYNRRNEYTELASGEVKQIIEFLESLNLPK